LIAIAGCYGMRAQSCYPGGPSDHDPEPTGAAAYFPLDVGNTWTYARVDGDSVLQENARSLTVVGKSAERTLVVYAGIRIGPDTVEYEADSHAVVTWAEWGAGSLIEAPLAIGNQWDATCISREIVAVDSVLSTPAGSFLNVLVIKESPIYEGTCPVNAVGWYEKRYYARGVGFVKWEAFQLHVGGVPEVLVSAHALMEYSVR